MTSMTPMTRTAMFRARGGRGAEPADGEPIGGARMLRGSTGATAFSIRQGWAHRHIVAGEIHVAFGSHSPGDGEMVADWWTT
jgi:hypothetical protein